MSNSLLEGIKKRKIKRLHKLAQDKLNTKMNQTKYCPILLLQ